MIPERMMHKFYAIKSGRAAAKSLARSLDSKRCDKSSLEDDYEEALKKGGLLSLRDVDFVEKALSTRENAESYVKGLKRMIPKR